MRHAIPWEWYDHPPRYDVMINGHDAHNLYCVGLVINGHAVCNPTGWYGHTPYCGMMINAMMRTIPALWCGDECSCGTQSHRNVILVPMVVVVINGQ